MERKFKVVEPVRSGLNEFFKSKVIAQRFIQFQTSMDTVCLSLYVSISLSLSVHPSIRSSICLVSLCTCAMYVHMPMDARREDQILKLELQVTVSHKT